MTRKHKSGGWLTTVLAFLALVAYYYFTQIPTTNVSLPPQPATGTVMGAITSEPVNPGGSWYEVYFTNPKTHFDGVTVGGIENHLIDKINASKTSIDLAVYEFSLEDVAQALIAAEKRGVKVRVVYDNEFADPDPQMEELKAVGIPAIPDVRSAFMHNKFFIFDGRCIWTGSFNISINAAYRNNENAVYFCSSEAAANYTTEFNEMFAGEFGPTSPENTLYPVFTVGNVKIENYFASEEDVMSHVVSTVSQATTYVHFMAFSFTDDSLGQAMLKDKERGVVVAGIFETRGADTQYSECGILLKQGVDVSLDGNPGTFHHKAIIIDGQTVIFGSFNFTSAANKSNDENLLIVHDPSLATAFEQQFQLLKSQSHETQASSCKTK